MVFRKQQASCEEARQIDIVSYLSVLGHEPKKIIGFDYWYLSPLRNEKTPSFKVNRRLNRWYDHGLGQGGNLIDFAILYNDCTVGEFLRNLDQSLSPHQPNLCPPEPPEKGKASRIIITQEKSLASPFLFHYLRQRRIPWQVAIHYCKEVAYELWGRKYFAIGFKNNSGGYELRNAFFKGSSAPKDVTSINIGTNEVAVFEGFIDFLSFVTIQHNGPHIQSDILVLNSVAFFERARPFMEQHEVINLYLDRDESGQNFTRHALSLSENYKDKSNLYHHYKDLNDWMMNIGKSCK